MSFFRRLRVVRLIFYLGVAACGFYNKEIKSLFVAPTGSNAAKPVAPAVASSPAPVTDVAPAPVAPPAPPAAPAWTPPVVVPAIPGGTLTTPEAIYTNAQIVKVEADRVTIMSDSGRAVIPTWQLPSSLQQGLNYNPQAALSAASNEGRIDTSAQPAAPNPLIDKLKDK